MNKVVNPMSNEHHVLYRIAGLGLRMAFPATLQRPEILPSFEPFLVDGEADENCVCAVTFSFGELPQALSTGKLLSDVSVVWGERFRFYEQDDAYVTTILNEDNGKLWSMRSNKDFSAAVIYSQDKDGPIANVLSWLLMVAFGQTCLLHQTILLHASVVANRGNGFAFLGKSGTGKSTHSRRWLEHIDGSELLNDDNPAVRLEENGEVFIYGTPWSGKTHCYLNKRVKMKAFVRLKQAKVNRLSWKEGMDALIGVLPSCTAVRWNKKLFNEMTNTLENILKTVPVAELECLPDQGAAELCNREILNHC